ncbi:Leucyl aminopeptidase [Staphylothermus hellenicus DSM 12710]|uniref:Probable cytosol aminopeptidase n=1 Tax=Staphylothermus hellenicus (strain DSM 12710 / JCM 10830 / BK20S6-10-b1 / P8) TaxID=591019 RepID=D7DC79_STAHD|nr:Leucyl aminopeptidase [Staphylothermus hellenicus DSM 12710]
MAKLKYILSDKSLDKIDVDTLIVPVISENNKPRIPEEIRDAYRELIDTIISSGDFKGEEKEVIIGYSRNRIKRLVLAGLGKEPDHETFREAVASAINSIAEKQSVHAGLYLRDLKNIFEISDLIDNSVLTIEITLFDPGELFKTENKKLTLKEMVLIVDNISEDMENALKRSTIISDAVNYARRIAETPSSTMNPARIEEEAKKLAEQYGLEIKVFQKEDLEKMGMNGILAVGSGGGIPPRLIILEYRGRNSNEWDYAFVGKTVTFDAGGLNLKPTGYIDNMKYDKCGGAVVLGIMKAVAELKLPVNVVAALPAVENLPGPNAYKPRDVIKMYNGLTVEVGNTDAEGRLILADALSYIDKNYTPKQIFDLATLTGAIVIALGNYAAGLFTENDEVAKKLYDIGWKIGERVWHMPLWKEYYEQLKSNIADTNNIGGRPAGAITAAAFLSKFVSDKKRWIHLDIAGVSFVEKGYPKKAYYKPAATGFGVRLLTYYLLKDLE